ncbi:hypothetical protein AB6A40_002163 [Gnathostoma spinigerum]|uniref:Uncharacterized protein n=1 Tax=Gnathostoma spinigerum TaxID=75299 RepID=A0ABD6EDM3_9BILA
MDRALEKEEAEQNGDMAAVQAIQSRIDALDARASELDRRRSQSIVAINWINQRNRDAMKDAILSGNVEVDTTSQDDPFTRKNARLKPVPGKDKSAMSSSKEHHNEQEGYAPKTEPTIAEKPSSKTPQKVSKVFSSGNISRKVDDLFSAHDFDVDLDIAIPAVHPPMVPTSSIDSLDSSHRSSSSSHPLLSSGSRPISLEDYKRRRGLL